MVMNGIGGLRVSQPAVPEVSIPIGFATIKIPIAGWRGMWATLRGKPLEEQVVLIPRFASLRVNRRDEGSFTCYVDVINLSRRALLLTRVVCDQWVWQNGVMPDLLPHVRGEATWIASRSIHRLSLGFQLNSAAIRTIVERTSPPSNSRSTPDARAELLLGVMVSQMREQVRMRVEFPIVDVGFYWDPAKGVDSPT